MKLWYLLIEGEQDAESGVIANFYTYGEHLGIAIDKAFNASKQQGFNNPKLLEATLLNFDEITNFDELIEIAPQTFMRKSRFFYPLDDDKDFISPIGITKDATDNNEDFELIKEGFTAYAKNSDGYFEIELVALNTHIINLFFELSYILPEIKYTELVISKDWEDHEVQRWVNDKFDKNTLKSFLTEQQHSILENGFVTIILHLNATILAFTDHKKIQISTKNEDLFLNFYKKLIACGYTQIKDELYNLEYGFYHLHYRPAESLNRSNFTALLQINNFKQI